LRKKKTFSNEIGGHLPNKVLLTHTSPWITFLIIFYNQRILHLMQEGSESDDAELSDCTLMALDYLEQADQRKIDKKS
jgi:hypothetical protein